MYEKTVGEFRYRKFTTCERVEECEDAFASEFIADGESVEDERE